MCGRVVQSQGPVHLTIVEGLNVGDSRLGNVPRRYNAAPSSAPRKASLYDPLPNLAACCPDAQASGVRWKRPHGRAVRIAAAA